MQLVATKLNPFTAATHFLWTPQLQVQAEDVTRSLFQSSSSRLSQTALVSFSTSKVVVYVLITVVTAAGVPDDFSKYNVFPGDNQIMAERNTSA